MHRAWGTVSGPPHTPRRPSRGLSELGTVVHRIVMVRSAVDRVYDSGPIDYNGAGKSRSPSDVIAVVTSSLS